MRFIGGDEVLDLLTMSSCIEVMKQVLTDIAKGEAIQELRSVMPIERKNVMGLMPGYLKREHIAGTKVITVFDDNHQKGLPSHQGVVLLFDAENGKLKAIVDGTAITAVRTAAVSAVATDLLARKDSKIVSLIGSGEQARSHLEAMLQVRPVQQVKIWSLRPEKAERFKKDMEQKCKVAIQTYESVKDAVADADIICTVTSAKEPVLKGEWVKPGAHVNAVGACQPKDRELDSVLVKESEFYVDRLESAVHESGDYLMPLKEGVIDSSHIIGEIGDLLTHKIKGRTSETSITVFESLGLAVEDLAAAHFIYQEAVRNATSKQGGKV